MFYAYETVNCTAVEFSTLAQAQAWITRVVPQTDWRGAPSSLVNGGYSMHKGWTAGTREQMLAECGDDANYVSADTMEAQYAEVIAGGYYNNVTTEEDTQ